MTWMKPVMEQMEQVQVCASTSSASAAAKRTAPQ
jgi:hypothetical protein